MIEEQAIVMHIQGRRALLEIERSQPCGLCGSTQGCGISLWGRIFGARRGGFNAENSLLLEVGERVIVGMPESGLLGIVLLAYLPPLLLLCLGAWGFTVFAGEAVSAAMRDAYAVTGGLLGLLAGFALVRFLSGGERKIGRYQPVMLRRAEGAPSKVCSKKVL